MLGDETGWRWEDSLCPGDSTVAAVYDDESEDCIALVCGPLPSHAFAKRRATLIVSAPNLAATVASEPERIAAARNALRVEVAAALAAWREADAKLYMLLTAGVSNDARRPAATEHRARFDALNELLAPETT